MYDWTSTDYGIQWPHAKIIHHVCACNQDFEAFLAAPMHMTPNYGHIPVMYYHLQPLKPLYMVTGALGTQIFVLQKWSDIL